VGNHRLDGDGTSFSHCNFVAQRHTVLVAGGSGDTTPSTLLSTAELYDPATGTWRETRAMGAGRLDHTATLLPNGKVLVAGGYGMEGDYANSLSSAELFDPATETWTATGTLNEKRRHHTANLLANGKVLIADGYGDVNDVLSTAELYDPATGAWTPTGALVAEPVVGTATLLTNGMVLVTKGYQPKNPGPGYDPVGQIFDTDTGTWTATLPLSIGSQYHSATLLADGEVLVAGGYSSGGICLSNADLYDPAIGVWASAGAMTTARKNHTATRLANGSVLVTGGYHENCTVLSSTEVYNSSNGVVTPMILTNLSMLPGGSLQFSFSSIPGALIGVLTTTNISLPLNQWKELGGVAEMPPGRFQFTDLNATNFQMRYYRAVASP
jgi:hypothetical protein